MCIIGTIFLIVCLVRAYAGHFTPKQHLGFEFAAWYWHFVDVVWLFLFACIYVWGGGAPCGCGRALSLAAIRIATRGGRAAAPFRSVARGVRDHEQTSSDVIRRPSLPQSIATGLAVPLSALRQGHAVRRLPRRCASAARPAASTIAFADAGDGPAVFVILIAGFIVVGAALIVEVVYQPPFWVHAVLWVPLILSSRCCRCARSRAC